MRKSCWKGLQFYLKSSLHTVNNFVNWLKVKIHLFRVPFWKALIFVLDADSQERGSVFMIFLVICDLFQQLLSQIEILLSLIIRQVLKQLCKQLGGHGKQRHWKIDFFWKLNTNHFPHQTTVKSCIIISVIKTLFWFFTSFHRTV